MCRTNFSIKERYIMANPITPSGRPRRASFNPSDPYDISGEARRQDEERRIREDNAIFERTGINRPPIPEYSPLVDDDRPDVARDGDSYDENNHTVPGEYAEDSPTRIIDSSGRTVSEIRGRTVSETYNDIARYNPRQRNRNSEQEAYMQRESIKENKEFQDKVDKRKKKFKNPIIGLGLDDE
jgi:hypothetical protein